MDSLLMTTTDDALPMDPLLQHYNALLALVGFTLHSAPADLAADLWEQALATLETDAAPTTTTTPTTTARAKGKEEATDDDDPKNHCQICSEPYLGVHTRMALPCAHMFCAVCVASWEKRRKEDGESACCPDCRYEYTEEEVTGDHDGPDLLPFSSPPTPPTPPKRKRSRSSGSRSGSTPKRRKPQVSQ